MSTYRTISPPPGYMSISKAMSISRASPYLHPDQNEYTIFHATNFIKNNLPSKMFETLTRLTFDMHQMIARLTINYRTFTWAIDPTGQNDGKKRLTIDNCKDDLKKIYTIYYNVYTMSLMPKGQVRDAFDPMKNFKNRLKVVKANMFLHTCLDGNTLDRSVQNSVIIP